MRTYWLGIVALLLTAGCTHDGKLRPQAGAVPMTEDGTAAVIGAHGVTLMAYGSTWNGNPRNLDRRFTAVEIRLENRSGRPLGIRYDNFTLNGQKHYVARDPNELGRFLADRGLNRTAPGEYNPPQEHSAPVSPQQTYQLNQSNLNQSSRTQSPYDTTYPTNGAISRYQSPPCYTCASVDELKALPSPDMLKRAFAEGPLEDGTLRQGFLYFEEPLLLEDHATLKVKLVDASTNETFGELSVPFEVH